MWEPTSPYSRGPLDAEVHSPSRCTRVMKELCFDFSASRRAACAGVGTAAIGVRGSSSRRQATFVRGSSSRTWAAAAVVQYAPSHAGASGGGRCLAIPPMASCAGRLEYLMSYRCHFSIAESQVPSARSCSCDRTREVSVGGESAEGRWPLAAALTSSSTRHESVSRQVLRMAPSRRLDELGFSRHTSRSSSPLSRPA